MDETLLARILAFLGLAATEEPATCPHCGHATMIRWGRDDSGNQRWRCKHCHQTFTARTGTEAAGLRQPKLFEAAVVDMLSQTPSSCRGLARTLGVERMTIWRWRRKVSQALARLAATDPPLATARLEARESRKASREWVNHERDPKRHPAPDRLRWVDYARRKLPLPDPLSPYLLAMRLGLDDTGGWWTRVRKLKHDTTSPLLRHAALNDGLRQDLRAFLKPFRGPAARHLEGYVAWFAARAAARLAEAA